MKTEAELSEMQFSFFVAVFVIYCPLYAFMETNDFKPCYVVRMLNFEWEGQECILIWF